MLINYEKEKRQKPPLERKVRMKTMKRSVVDMERIVSRLQMEKSLLMRTSEELVFGSSQTAMSGCRILDNFFKLITSLYLEVAFIAEKGILRDCSRDVSQLIWFITEPKRNWKRRSEQLVELGSLQEDGTIFARMIFFFRIQNLYALYAVSRQY